MTDDERLIAKLRKQFEGSGSFGAPIFELCDLYEQLRSETLGPPASATQLRECAKARDALQARVTLLEGLLREVDTHDIEHEPACHPAAGCSCDVYELGARIDAALSHTP